MKKCINLLFFFISLGGFSQEGINQIITPNESSYQAFQDGEWFEFRLHYGIFNASYATLKVEEDTIDNVPVFHAKGYGRTTGLARWFFKVEDHYDSYFTKSHGLPLLFIRDIDEGGYTKDVEIRFDHDKNIAFVNDKKKKIKSEYSTKENVQDLISAFYFLRNFYDTSTIEVGESVGLNMFFDNENYLFRLKFLGREVISTKFGKVNTLKFRPYVQSGRVFRAQESVTLWISDDPNKIPIKMRADLAIGAIDCDLENFKNLRHPFKIVVP